MIEQDTITAQATSSPKPMVLSLTIKEKSSLHSAYMPFVKGGGLFIPTNKPYKMGDEVFMLLTLLDEPSKLQVVGHVIWISPVAQTGRPQGVGVQFNEDATVQAAQSKIEELLGSLLTLSRATHTI